MSVSTIPHGQTNGCLRTCNQVFRRAYYGITISIDLAYLATKIASYVVTKGISCLFSSRSKLFNHLAQVHWKHTVFAINTLALSIVGVFDPEKAFVEKSRLAVAKTKEKALDKKLIENLTFKEQGSLWGLTTLHAIFLVTDLCLFSLKLGAMLSLYAISCVQAKDLKVDALNDSLLWIYTSANGAKAILDFLKNENSVPLDLIG